MFDGDMVRLQPADPKRTPTGAADIWRLAARPGRWADHAHCPCPRLQPPDAWSTQPWALGAHLLTWLQPQLAWVLR